VLRSPAEDGQAVTFARPFSDLELENFLLKMARSRRTQHRLGACRGSHPTQPHYVLAHNEVFPATFS
jgi:hypothetical protein